MDGPETKVELKIVFKKISSIKINLQKTFTKEIS